MVIDNNQKRSPGILSVVVVVGVALHGRDMKLEVTFWPGCSCLPLPARELGSSPPSVAPIKFPPYTNAALPSTLDLLEDGTGLGGEL